MSDDHFSRVRPYLASEPADEPSWNTSTGFRPFVLTAGRVHADGGDTPDIGLDTHVVARWGESTDALSPEQREIVRLCVESLSVVEISARIGLHVGVTMVLVGDLAAAGHLVVHETTQPEGPSVEIMNRVADGLRSL
ncbi:MULTISPECIES: DUF742 domain-containing protein [Catenuloplanes]|uniref:DNA-directed RNA polymerase specialized sigma24 family protein n=1 Tax=Catenuloplanes niger TaxID=587534 RepID=A0AAE3ZQW2_9ACTN|nr:DUF742 domain-containing protein [Catenuloplanes niger]MDR7323319.1 DNA-directed RNA polymerase specialized sigma24 family protein [Catenuloplanes niger]